jgi:hypothetical protein
MTLVIPGCAEGADPESRDYYFEIPGSMLRIAPEMTEEER